MTTSRRQKVLISAIRYGSPNEAFGGHLYVGKQFTLEIGEDVIGPYEITGIQRVGDIEPGLFTVMIKIAPTGGGVLSKDYPEGWDGSQEIYKTIANPTFEIDYVPSGFDAK